MAVMSDNGGAVLQYVTRMVDGELPDNKVKFDKSSNKVVKIQQDNVETKVIVFFPNRSVQVMNIKDAERKGFLRQPDILGFESVVDAQSAAGQYKFAMRIEDRADAWLKMENALIGHCISKNGIPLPHGVGYSNRSLWTNANERIDA